MECISFYKKQHNLSVPSQMMPMFKEPVLLLDNLCPVRSSFIIYWWPGWAKKPNNGTAFQNVEHGQYASYFNTSFYSFSSYIHDITVVVHNSLFYMAAEPACFCTALTWLLQWSYQCMMHKGFSSSAGLLQSLKMIGIVSEWLAQGHKADFHAQGRATMISCSLSKHFNHCAMYWLSYLDITVRPKIWLTVRQLNSQLWRQLEPTRRSWGHISGCSLPSGLI